MTSPAQDWPQWRGPTRDGAAAALPERSARPKALEPGWKVRVGSGHSSPVVAGERIHLMTREGKEEVVFRPGAGRGT